MADHLITFSTTHYLLIGAFSILLALLITHEIGRGGRRISTGELTGLVNRDEGVVVDIRPVKDFAAGHIVGSLNIPQDKLMTSITKLDKYKGKTIILVDTAGQHSGIQARELLRVGHNAVRLSGGIASWRADNLPAVK